MNEKVWKISCSWILVSSLTMTGEVKAACTPTPDCASIGYTETSCEGDFVRCPFDISKLYCIPCDSSFKYDCSGANMTGGVGTACNGKYAFCACSGGGEFSNGVCPQNCTVGMIYYSDKSCSNDLDNSKTAIGVVVKDNELVIINKLVHIPWGGYGTDVSDLTNYSPSAAIKDYDGRNNTAKIVAAHTNESTSTSAAKYCNSYSTEGTSAGDWYLAAAGELYTYVYGNYGILEPIFKNTFNWVYDWRIWSSSEYSSTNAFGVHSNSGEVGSSGVAKSGDAPVGCFLDIR